jgi:transposase-like protein
MRKGAVRYLCKGCKGSVTHRVKPRLRKDTSSDRKLFMNMVSQMNIRDLCLINDLTREQVYTRKEYTNDKKRKMIAVSKRLITGLLYGPIFGLLQ